MIDAQTITPIALIITLLVVLLILWPTWKRERRLKKWQIVLLFGAPFVVLIGTGITIMFIQKPAQSAFLDMMPEYKGVEKFQPGEAYLSGKVVVIEKYVNRLHDIYYDLPKELKANTPEEVGSVAVVNCTGTVRAYQVFGGTRKPIYDSSNCEIELIDWKIPAIINVHRISQSGSSPELLWDDVVDYLLALPAKGN